MHQWVLEFFRDVPRDVTSKWSQVSAPISRDVNVIRIKLRDGTIDFAIVGEFYDMQAMKDDKGKYKMEVRTIIGNTTIVWETPESWPIPQKMTVYKPKP